MCYSVFVKLRFRDGLVSVDSKEKIMVPFLLQRSVEVEFCSSWFHRLELLHLCLKQTKIDQRRLERDWGYTFELIQSNLARHALYLQILGVIFRFAFYSSVPRGRHTAVLWNREVICCTKLYHLVVCPPFSLEDLMWIDIYPARRFSWIPTQGKVFAFVFNIDVGCECEERSSSRTKQINARNIVNT